MTFTSAPGAQAYGLSQNKYLLQRACAEAITSSFTDHDDGTLSYTSDLTLRLTATGESMHRPRHPA